MRSIPLIIGVLINIISYSHVRMKYLRIQTQIYRASRLSKISMRNLIRHLIYHTMPWKVPRWEARLDSQDLSRAIRLKPLLMEGVLIISSNLKWLNLYTYPSIILHKVLVGNGEQLKCEGEVQNILVQIQGHYLYVSAYVLPIAATELVLGSQ